MTLRRKLLTVFVALAIMSLSSTGLTIWSSFWQHRLLDELEDQYTEGIALHRIGATSATLFRRYALSRISDAASSAVRVAELDEEIRGALGDWKRAATSARSGARQAAVEDAYGHLFADLSRPPPSYELDELPQVSPTTTAAIRGFRRLLSASLEANVRDRDAVRKRFADLRHTVQLASALSVLATLCLVLLLIAYVGSDIFAPLRDLEHGLRRLAQHEGEPRLDGERDDELGAVNRTFNTLAARVEALRVEYHGLRQGVTPGTEPAAEHRGLAIVRDELRERARSLRAELADDESDLQRQLDELCAAVESMTRLYFPPELKTSSTSVNDLLYDALTDHRHELSRRGVSLRLTTPTSDLYIDLDRDTVREALRLLVRAALSHGVANLELRAQLSEGETGRFLLIELNEFLPQDSGVSFEVPGWSRPGLELVRDVAERHGGSVKVSLTPPHVRRTSLLLPARQQSAERLNSALG